MRTWILVLLAALGCAAQDVARQSEPATGNAGWELSGTIKRQGKPLKDVWVLISGPELIRSTRTDSQGRYSLKGTIPGTYSIRIQKPDDAAEPRSRTITLTSGHKVDGFDFVIPVGSVIAGRVADRAGQPVTGMVVLAYTRSHELGALRLFEKGGAVTDDRGAYRIAHLPDGAYLVAAVPGIRRPLRVSSRQAEPARPLAPAYPPVTFAPSGRSHATAATIDVRQGEERTGIDITLEKEPGYCLYFRPVTAYPDSTAALQVAVDVTEWLDTRGPQVAQGSVRPGQDSQICGLPTGEYRFSLFAYIKQPMKGIGYGQSNVLVDKRHVDLGSRDMMSPQPLHGIVKVRGAKPDEPVPGGIRIVLLLRNRSMLPNDTLFGLVQPDGGFRLREVYPDSYGLRVENLPAGHYIVKADQSGRDVTSAEVRPDGDGIRIELAPDGPTLTGRVLTGGRDPVPVPEATVFLVPERGDQARVAQADQSGVYLFASGVEPGDYKLVAVPDLPESQRRDGRLAERFLSGASDVKLSARENKVVDLTVRDAP